MFNCALPEAISIALASLKHDETCCNELRKHEILLGAYANRLTPVDPSWTMAESSMPQPFREDIGEHQYWNDFVRLWVEEYGVQLVGGCCGITPEHIACLRDNLKERLIDLP